MTRVYWQNAKDNGDALCSYLWHLLSLCRRNKLFAVASTLLFIKRFAIARLIIIRITVQVLRVVFTHAQTTIKCRHDCNWANPLTA
jgi:hypothetical protein